MAIFSNPGFARARSGSSGGGAARVFLDKKEQQRKEASSKKTAQLIREIQAAPDKDAAFQLASSPEYSDLFEDPEDYKSFGFLVDQIKGGDNEERTSVVPVTMFDEETGNVTGKTAFFTEKQRQEVANAKDRGAALNKILGVEEGQSVRLGDISNVDTVDIVDLKTGRQTRRVAKERFDTNKLEPGEGTAQDFSRMMQLQRGVGSQAASTDTTDVAKGMLQLRGLPTTDANINLAKAVRDRTDKFSNRLATAYRMVQTEQGFIEKIENSGDSQRFTAAQTVMEDLMFNGLTGSQAFSAAKNVGDAIPVESVGPGGESVTRPPKKPAVQLTTETTKNLTTSHVGRVYNLNGRLYVFVGFKDNEPNFQDTGIDL